MGLQKNNAAQPFAEAAQPAYLTTSRMLELEMADLMARDYLIPDAIIRVTGSPDAGYEMTISAASILERDTQLRLMNLDVMLMQSMRTMVYNEFPVILDDEARRVSAPSLDLMIAFVGSIPTEEPDEDNPAPFTIQDMLDADKPDTPKIRMQ